jgi:hypothetical protein
MHLSDPDEDLQHVVSVGKIVGTAGLNATTKNFANNFHLIHQN